MIWRHLHEYQKKMQNHVSIRFREARKNYCRIEWKREKSDADKRPEKRNQVTTQRDQELAKWFPFIFYFFHSTPFKICAWRLVYSITQKNN